MNPTEGRYLSSYVLNPYTNKEDTKYIALITGGIFEAWFISTQWAGLILQIYMNLLYLQTMSTSMNGLKKTHISTM